MAFGSASDGRWLSFRVFPTPAGVATLFYNDTEQQSLRREQEAGVALEHAVRAHADIATVRLDARGRIAAAGAAFERWTGFAAADVAGHRLADLLTPGSRRDFNAAFERVLRELKPLQLSLTMIARSGAEALGVLALAPIVCDVVAQGAQAVWTCATPRPAAAAAM